MKKLKLAVVGKDVSKSSSPQMHKIIAENLGEEIEYGTISVPPEELPAREEEVL